MRTVGRLLKSIPTKDKTNSFFTMLYMAKAFDIDLFLFSPKDVDYKQRTINGLFFEGGKEVRKNVPIPPLVDNQFNIIDKELSQFSLLTRHSLGLSKYGTYEILLEDGKYKDLLIPSETIKSFDNFNIDTYMQKYNNQILLKPTNGQNGAGVIKIAREDDIYLLTSGNKTTEMTLSEVSEHLHNIDRIYLIQPVINCRTKKDEPFDIRVRCVRYGKPKEIEVNLYPRVGNANGIISNIHAGGYSIPADYFLKNEFGDKGKQIYDDLITLGKEFVPYYQDFCKGEIFEIGLDIGITTNNEGDYKFFMFEANSFPNGTINLGGNTGTHLIIAYFKYFNYLYDKYIPRERW